MGVDTLVGALGIVAAVGSAAERMGGVGALCAVHGGGYGGGYGGGGGCTEADATRSVACWLRPLVELIGVLCPAAERALESGAAAAAAQQQHQHQQHHHQHHQQQQQQQQQRQHSQQGGSATDAAALLPALEAAARSLCAFAGLGGGGGGQLAAHALACGALPAAAALLRLRPPAGGAGAAAAARGASPAESLGIAAAAAERAAAVASLQAAAAGCVCRLATGLGGEAACAQVAADGGFGLLLPLLELASGQPTELPPAAVETAALVAQASATGGAGFHSCAGGDPELLVRQLASAGAAVSAARGEHEAATEAARAALRALSAHPALNGRIVSFFTNR